LHPGKPSPVRSTQPAVRSDSSPLPVTAYPPRQWINCGRRRTPSSLCLWRRSVTQFIPLPARRGVIAHKDSRRWRKRVPERRHPTSRSFIISAGKAGPTSRTIRGPKAGIISYRICGRASRRALRTRLKLTMRKWRNWPRSCCDSPHLRSTSTSIFSTTRLTGTSPRCA